MATASANFPALLMAIFWRRFTTWGAVASIVVGAVAALVLIYISPIIQEDVLGKESSLFPLKNPALISMPLAFLAGIVVSLLTRDVKAESRFYQAERQILLGAPAAMPVQPPAAMPVQPVVARRRPTR